MMDTYECPTPSETPSRARGCLTTTRRYPDPCSDIPASGRSSRLEARLANQTDDQVNPIRSPDLFAKHVEDEGEVIHLWVAPRGQHPMQAFAGHVRRSS
jgi:hypothetical protein